MCMQWTVEESRGVDCRKLSYLRSLPMPHRSNNCRCVLFIHCCLTGPHKPTSLPQCWLSSQVCRSGLWCGRVLFRMSQGQIRALAEAVLLSWALDPLLSSLLVSRTRFLMAVGPRSPCSPLPSIISSQYGCLLSSKPAECVSMTSPSATNWRRLSVFEEAGVIRWGPQKKICLS